ncbi:MAG: bifunctional enoyl-CoA hydratase/phosphate acetyltransferase [Burkholderiales bacterium]|nr:bifunctional enoyl-CoA hydratase/phosphate acetyltransferase [Burkholderiales bacterium]
MQVAENDVIENITYDDLYLGRSANLVRTLSLADIQAFAAVSGDVNPAHVDAEYAAQTLFHGVIAHGMWGGALISTLLGTEFPGPGTIYVEQSLRFLLPVRIGDTLTVMATVVARDDKKKRVTLDCQVSKQDGALALSGTAIVIAPTVKVRRARMTLPTLQVFDADAKLQALLAPARAYPPIRCAIVHPCDAISLRAAVAAQEQGLIIPVLVGPQAKIQAQAQLAEVDIRGIELVAVAHSHAACEYAVNLAAQGQVQALMLGSVNPQELLHAVLACPALQTKRRLSHVLRFDLAGYEKPFLLTDAGINVTPTLLEKADIVQNAIVLAQALGVIQPLVALLAAQDTINVKLPSTIDAAALCKMAERGQITGGVLDGPIGFDRAIASMPQSSWPSAVAGNADIVLVPDLEAGNLLAKQLQTMAGALYSGIVMGARVPIALIGTNAGLNAHLASLAMAQRLSHFYANTSI